MSLEQWCAMATMESIPVPPPKSCLEWHVQHFPPSPPLLPRVSTVLSVGVAISNEQHGSYLGHTVTRALICQRPSS